ncbi:hypothetical protein [Alkalihalobacillus trypoxylicola]|uniref:Uncharacterized protein n=1 Tax=Alkalihalobacillus trypoxylicola TaxID=519424 RepID=A0A161QAR6_9BACI|nr:hypothetical protein [Alkalihalobacillus trypoxylicola]KYG34927.1 hypothetical protein AZF04_00930 [Alkalihalobacillus trypoxylicola]
MAENLQDQIYIYSLSTESFLSDEERKIHDEKQTLELGMSLYKDILNKLESTRVIEDKDLEKYYKAFSFANVARSAPLYNFYFFGFNEMLEERIIEELTAINRNKKQINKLKKQLFEPYNNRITNIVAELDKMADQFEGIRTLRNQDLIESNIISQFDSVLTRALGINKDETTDDIIMIRAYRYKIFEKLVVNGFTNASGEKYCYFTSSAGGIRNKKSVFIKKSVLDKVQSSLFAGLTRERINKNGGMNPNKYNAYTALSMTASVEWEGFNIENCIVVDDLETSVFGTVDYIDENYNINRKKNYPVDITHTDGAGICLPSVSNKAIQIRLPFFKGLLIPTPFDKFINENPGASPVVTDIYGKEWNVIKDDISIIFTKSQFKAWGYFINREDKDKSWDDYRTAFNEFNCEAAIAMEEVDEDGFDDKLLSYQVLQTLTDVSNSELEYIASQTVHNINKFGNDLDVILDVLGANDENEHKNSFQEAIDLYPNLVNDEHTKEEMKETRRALIKRAKSGKLLLSGNKRVFIAPDTYAFCEKLFLNIDQPKGLLNDGEVSCSLYDDGQKLDVLRSPHLYKEHSINVNKVNKDIKEWFVTNCIYTSVESLISQLLMFDVDGDEALIVSDEKWINIVERNIKGVVPLQYSLKSAQPDIIDNQIIFNSLKSAYEKNIGTVNNQITKVWNSGAVDENAVRVVKWLCLESNAVIDYAKTLWMPTRPNEVDKEIKKFANGRVPHFFISAKNKSKKNVAKINNSVVNRLERDKIIPPTSKHIIFKDVVGTFDYSNLLYNKSVNINSKLAVNIIEKYDELNRKKHWAIKKESRLQGKSMRKVEFRVIKDIRKQLRLIKNDDVFIADVLVEYLYEKRSKNKNLLWDAFGHVIVWNINRNVHNKLECLDCKCEVEITKERQIRCEMCQIKRNKHLDAVRKRKSRQSKKQTEKVS